jgi:transketolase N-terminal domain/subunit
MISGSRSAHIGTSLSVVEILVGLYFSSLNVDPKNPQKADRDRFLLSKGHGCAALRMKKSWKALQRITARFGGTPPGKPCPA